jgi:NAD(P)-dependent dehydrogenase (short-subunit alcohol dehydrogenase family)
LYVIASDLDNVGDDLSSATLISSHTALGRPARIEELDGPIVFLAGDASSYITCSSTAAGPSANRELDGGRCGDRAHLSR